MTTTHKFSRRAALAIGLAAPVAAGVTIHARPTLADGHSASAMPTHASFGLGDLKITTLLDGTGAAENPQQNFGINVSPEEFARVSEENFIPSDVAQGFFTPTLVDTGSQVILFDTGLGRGGIQSALAEAGYTPDDVDLVVLTHMHPDHIGGLTGESGPTFPNASYVAGSVENNFWSQMEAGTRMGDAYAAKVAPLLEKMSFIDDGDSPAPGITAVAAFGHTPGHMTFRIESNGDAMMLTGDLANHHIWAIANPDWHFRFDGDVEAAIASRRKILGMLADERIPFVGYHLPFPALGFIEANGDSFRYVPQSYQIRLRS